MSEEEEEEDRIHLINAYMHQIYHSVLVDLYFFTESLTIVLFTKTW